MTALSYNRVLIKGTNNMLQLIKIFDFFLIWLRLIVIEDNSYLYVE
jgi:hypothetical protein